MQIVSCTKRNTGDGVDRKKGELQQFEDRQVEEWDIVVDVAGASSSWIIANAPLPNYNSAHPDNSNLKCTGLHQIRRAEGSPIHFVAIVNYEGLPSGATELPPGEDLEKIPAQREREPYLEEWSTLKTQEPIDVTHLGEPICTVNGEQFDPPITIDVHDIQITYGKNVEQRNMALIEAVGKMNRDAFAGFDLFQCIIDSVNYKYLLDPKDNKTYWRQTVTVIVRTKFPPDFAPDDPGSLRKVWDTRIRAEGYKVKVDGVEKPQNAKDGDGNQSATPVLHNRDTGKQIDDPKQAQWYRFITRESTQFGPLNID